MCIEDDFLTPVMKKPKSGDALLDLVLTYKEELTGAVNAGDSAGCSDNEMWSSGSMEKRTRQIARLQLWN